MSLLDDLRSGVNIGGPVRSVLIGSHWIVVCSRNCGLASALRGNHSHSTPEVHDAGKLHLKSARDLVELLRSDSLLEKSIGMAALNAVLDVDESQAIEMNAAEVLVDRGKDKKVALVGRFPFIPQLQQVVKQLWVLEQRPTKNEYPADAAPELLPRADLVAITGTAIINGTMESLLKQCQSRSTIMVLGPSTPLSPVLFDYGVDILSGSRVTNEEAVLRTVGQSASFRQVEGVKLLTIIRA